MKNLIFFGLILLPILTLAETRSGVGNNLVQTTAQIDCVKTTEYAAGNYPQSFSRRLDRWRSGRFRSGNVSIYYHLNPTGEGYAYATMLGNVPPWGLPGAVYQCGLVE